ncbi:MAG: pantoate--beta-alanine ligase [Deltaproteobacteria bacterium]|nr:pantoate--beta-alanine ligase [Deltaproteobacteria bacterium]
MEAIEKIEGMKEFSSRARASGKTIALVPTMGCLHRGHIELIKKAKTLCDIVVLSVFVNPAQFGPAEDYERYPRNMERDINAALREGVDVLFNPSAGEIYPEDYLTFVDVEKLPARLCGLSRPGHFKGVTTVVVKFFNIVMPHAAVFGLKDYQQQLIIKRMVKDLNMDVEIATVETVRDTDGLAMSSRNEYLSKSERAAARCVPRSIGAAEAAYLKGERDAANIIEKARGIIGGEPLVKSDYVVVCDPETLIPVEMIKGRAVILLAVRIGDVRLIDNCMLG